MLLFATPELTQRDLEVLGEIEEFRRDLRHSLHDPKRWTGVLRRNLLAKAIQGSNSIEGYSVNDDDAVAAVEEEEPLDADAKTWAEITGYRTALSYVMQLAGDPHFSLDETLVRSLHYMMLSHDLSKSPGRYRQGPIYVTNEATEQQVYEGPAAELVGDLVHELMDTLALDTDCPSFVTAAMAHLNLVMIHPFRDGNGRMARCLQTLVLARDQILSPQFSSIEEFLGANTPAYYGVLAEVGAGSWHPERDASPWIRFNLRAHHIQAQTVVRRAREAALLWVALEELAEAQHLPPRAVDGLYAAAIGLRLRRSSYEKFTSVEPRTATRDLQAMVNLGLLTAEGETKGRRYRGSRLLRDLRQRTRGDVAPVKEPYFDVPSRSAHSTVAAAVRVKVP